MSAGDVATVLKTVKVFVDFIPDPVKTPVSALLNISISICERVEQVSANVQAVADLAEQQAGISADVVNELRGVTQAQISAGGWIPRLEQLTRALEEVRNWVFKDSEDIEGDSKSGKALKALGKLWNSPEKKKEIDALKAKLDETREQLKLQLDIATLIGVQRITEIARALLQFHDEKLVARLKPVFSARYGAHGSPGDCLPETRLALRSDLRESLTVDDGQRIVWLSGLAGTGKSTVARSICSDLKDTHDVISFFIKRGIVERSDQRRTLHTLVYQLAQCIPRVFSAVVHAKEDLFDAHIHDQVNDLVATPLSTGLPGARPIVIVLDAADERDATSPNECDLIPCFLDAIATATVHVRVLVTSRGHPSDFLRPTYDSDAVHATQGLPQSVVKTVSMHDESYNPDSDIEAYLVEQFKRVAMKRSLSHWPTVWQIDDLVRMSARLFIFAATIIRWVDCSAPVFALDQLLKQSSALMERTGPGTIFALYEYVIGNALDEDTPQQLLRSALGKNPDERSEANVLCREVTLSILSTLRCLREPLTRNVFVQLWAGYLIAEPALYQGAVAIAGHLISRLSGVLFVWEPDSSMTLLHASFGDFLDAPSSRYHVSSEATHFDLASKCVSIMLTTKDAYVQLQRTSSVDLLLNHRLNMIPWIPDSDLVARYSFAHWISHARSAPDPQRAGLLEQDRLAERGFWFAGLFLHPAYINDASLQQAWETMRDAEAAYAYTFATVVYMCSDEASDFKEHPISLRIRSFEIMWVALSMLSDHEATLGTARFDDLFATEDRRSTFDELSPILTDVLNILDLWMVIREYQGPFFHGCQEPFFLHPRQLKAAKRGELVLVPIGYLPALAAVEGQALTLQSCISTMVALYDFSHDMVDVVDRTGIISIPKWPSNFSTRINHLAAVLDDFQQHMRHWKEEMEKLTSIAQELEKWAEEFRYAIRESRYQLVKEFDKDVIAALDRRNAGLTNERTHGEDGPLDSTLSPGHSLGVDAPPLSERQPLQVDEVLPAELHSTGSVDPSPSQGPPPHVDEPHLSEGESSQVATPLPREERATVTTSTASTVCFFAVLVLLIRMRNGTGCFYFCGVGDLWTRRAEPTKPIQNVE